MVRVARCGGAAVQLFRGGGGAQTGEGFTTRPRLTEGVTTFLRCLGFLFIFQKHLAVLLTVRKVGGALGQPAGSEEEDRSSREKVGSCQHSGPKDSSSVNHPK